MDTTACDLFRRCLERHDPDDWDGFIARFERTVYAVTRKVLVRQGLRQPDQEIDEIVQELYLRLWILDEHSFNGRTDRELWRFLGRTARNLGVDHQRRAEAARRCRKRLRERERESANDVTADSPERHAMVRQDLRGVFHRFRRAACDFRVELKLRVLRLAYFEGCTSVEIAQRLRGGLTSSQVDAMIHRLRRKLADEGLLLRRRLRPAPG